MSYMIRSMTTTDYSQGVPPVPFHLYLMRPELRRGAWWSQFERDAMIFDTIEAAEAYWLQHWSADHLGRQDIVPVGFDGPPVWEAYNHRPANEEAL